MTWEDIMRRVLPPIGSVPPHVTGPGAFGAGVKEGRKLPSTIPHKGVDFNYFGGRNASFNISNPALHSPVAGVVTNIGGRYGIIAIRDANGFSHEILHTHSRKVRVGDLVGVGQPIGTMGNTGVKRAYIEDGDPHVHYQLRDRAGNVVNPTEFWNQLDPGKDDPGQPAFINEYKNDLDRLDANTTPDVPDPQNSFDGHFGKWGSVPASAAPPAAPDRPESFDNRFGNWGSAPAGGFGDSSSPVLRALERNRRSAAPDGSAPAPAQAASLATPMFQPDSAGTGGVLGKYFDASVMPPVQGVSPSWPSFASSTAPDFSTDETGSVNDMPVRILSRRVLNPSPTGVLGDTVPAAPSPQANGPLGIFSGKPMPDYPVPPPILGLLDRSRVNGDDDENWYTRWRGLIRSE